MRKLIYISAIIFALSGCSKDDEDNIQQTECFAELCYKLVPEYGMLERIIAFDSSFGDYPNSVTYDIMYHENPVEIERHFDICDKLGIKLNYNNNWKFWAETQTDKITFDEAGATIICRCPDRIDKAKRIFQQFNSKDNGIAENLY